MYTMGGEGGERAHSFVRLLIVDYASPSRQNTVHTPILLLSQPEYRYTSYSFLACSCSLPETAVSLLSRSPLGRADMFPSPSLLSTPLMFKCSSCSTSCPYASVAFFYLSFYFCLVFLAFTR